jgi:hypothetical protein
MSYRLLLFGVIPLLLLSCKSIVGGGAALREDVAEIEQGMRKTQVEEKLGRPWNVNVTSTRAGQREQWVYKEAGLSSGRLYIYFQNGAVTATQY